MYICFMAEKTPDNSALHNWLQLVRLPNLLTVPGDPVAGLALASAWIGIAPPLRLLLLAAVVSVLLYAYGIIINDVVDLRADKKNRPGRPLAEGSVSFFLALPVGVVCAVAGLALAFLGGQPMFWTAIALCGAATTYNLLFKRFTILGSVNMGLCRALSVMVGAAALQIYAAPAILAALGVGFFVACVTWIADHEEEFFDFENNAFLPIAGYGGAILFAGGLSLVSGPGERFVFSLVPAALGVARIALLCKTLSRGAIAPGVTQRSVGAFLRALIPLQAALILMGHGLLGFVLSIAMVFLIWPAARVLSHQFYAS